MSNGTELWSVQKCLMVLSYGVYKNVWEKNQSKGRNSEIKKGGAIILVGNTLS